MVHGTLIYVGSSRKGAYYRDRALLSFLSLHLNGTVLFFVMSPGCFSSFTVEDSLLLKKKKVKVLTKQTESETSRLD